MKGKLALILAVAGLALASAKSYTVELLHPALVGGTELKAGEYKVELVDQKVVLSRGKIRSEAPVKVETGNAPFDSTTVLLSGGDGKQRVQEIRLGGTKTTLVLGE
jgi:hypothetical protein